MLKKQEGQEESIRILSNENQQLKNRLESQEGRVADLESFAKNAPNLKPEIEVLFALSPSFAVFKKRFLLSGFGSGLSGFQIGPWKSREKREGRGDYEAKGRKTREERSAANWIAKGKKKKVMLDSPGQ